MEFDIAFYLLLPVIAFLYASVGHGGASGYLALMALFNAQTAVMKPAALLLNLFIAGVSFLMYFRSGHFRWKLFYPFALTSIPAAFIGGYIQLDADIYKIILAIFLFFSVLKLMGWIGVESSENQNPSMYISLLAGFAIGFTSGLIGIGGGIILSPIILIFHWANMKETAAVSALFIWINSLSGLSGYMFSGSQIPAGAYLLVLIALIGGLLGAYVGSTKLNSIVLQRMLAFVLLIAGIKLLLT
ncbi:MAG TPA: hypothetical protein DCX54_09875 [Flavobacteriales bacterium]|nr:hypothetical protein [Flavobacteriales bacterium]